MFTLETPFRTFLSGMESGLFVSADPPQLHEDATYDAALQLGFLAQDGARAKVDLTLHVRALSFPCEYPARAFDFGDVVVGEHVTLAYVLHSRRGVPDVATLGGRWPPSFGRGGHSSCWSSIRRNAMHWFDELSQLGWLVILWIISTVALIAMSWLLTRQGSGGSESAQRPRPRPSTPRPS